MGEKNNDLLRKLIFPTSIVALMWLVKIIEVAQDIRYTRWGIFPRVWEGIVGILTAPFIHKDWQHLMSNSLPMFMLMSIMMVFYKRNRHTIFRNHYPIDRIYCMVICSRWIIPCRCQRCGIWPRFFCGLDRHLSKKHKIHHPLSDHPYDLWKLFSRHCPHQRRRIMGESSIRWSGWYFYRLSLQECHRRR